MKRIGPRNTIHFLVIAGAIGLAACASNPGGTTKPASRQPSNAPRLVKYGRLQVLDGRLCGDDGKPVQLRGMSTAGLQWYAEAVNAPAFATLAEDWKADVVRLTLYVGERGYATFPEIKRHVERGIELAVAQGLYVIVNWVVHIPGNPNDPIYAGAQAFFDDISRKYGKHPNLLYEIMSEPNGDLDWAKDIKPYAEKTVATIRTNDPKGIILIGSGTWSQDVDIAAADPLVGHNLAYAFHFYAGTHGEPLRLKVRKAIERGVAVFASEWGTSDYTGNGGPYLRESEVWLDFLDHHGISWVNWGISDKSESSAAIKSLLQVMQEGNTAVAKRESLLVPETIGPEGFPIWAPEELTPSGNFVRARLRAQAEAEGPRR